ncbi:MAG: tetratricopeptide repeat protein [Planctomycetaceae bacterium]|nr:tetratricopeptide repeat protein [Planctomycetaceae bacterium]
MSKTRIFPKTGRLALSRTMLTLIVLCVPGMLTAQQPVGKSSRPQVRFDGGDVLFLGLWELNDSVRQESFDGYGVVSIPCKGSPPTALRQYHFALAMPNALERDLLDDSADGTWQRWDIVSAALVAEGLSDRQRVDAYRKKGASLLRHVAPHEKSRRVQAVFETLHGRLLTGKYDVACTNLAQAIDTGDFNCVSATVLFHAMAQQAGFDVCGLEMRGHALSRVRFDQQVIDLETTCADWFHLSEHERHRPDSPGNVGYDTAYKVARRQMPQTVDQSLKTSRSLDAEMQATRSASHDPADFPPALPPNEVPGSFREISDVQLIATIYYNRGVDELTAGHFCAAAVANIKALQLDPQNENAWRNLMATFNNWAIARASEGDYLNAAQLLDEGRFIDDSYELFRANQVHTYYHWVVDVAERHDYDKALTLLRLAEDRLPSQANLRFLNFTIRRKMANGLIASQEDRKAFEQFDLATEVAPDGINAVEAEVVDVTQHVRQLIDGNKLSRAIWLIDRELDRHTTTVTLAQSGPNADPLRFAGSLPDAPVASPLLSNPAVFGDDEASTDMPIVVQPHPGHATPSMAKPSAVPSSTAGTRPYVAARPGNEQPVTGQRITAKRYSVKPELLGQLQTLRADAVVAWANESIKQRDYPEAVRRLTIGEPSQDQFSDRQGLILRQTYTDWAAALRSENRHGEAQTVLQLAADSPYLAK